MGGGGGGEGETHLNQNCRKFHEMDKSMKKFFFTVWAVGGWGGIHLTAVLTEWVIKTSNINTIDVF